MNKEKIARVANEAVRLSRKRGGPRLSADSDVDELIAWLQWNDPNGNYHPEDDPDEEPISEGEAWGLVRDALRDDL